MKNLRYCIIVAVFILCLGTLAGCGSQGSSESTGSQASVSEDTPVTKDISAMDTVMTLTAYGKNGQAAVDAAAEEVEKLDSTLSTGNENSEISKLNQAGSATLGEDAGYLVKRALEINKSTDGAFDITVYPLMKAWGFTTKDYKVPSEAEIQSLLKNVDSSKIEFDEESGQISLPENVEIDLGGIAKGYTSSRIMEIFKEQGVTSGLVSLGGNVQLLGKKPDGNNWKVGIEAPEDDANDYAGVLEISDCAVITSGGYERYFEKDGVRYHHIIDPSTGKPADSGLTSVTIVSEDGTLADGLSTSLFIMGEKKAKEYWKKHSDEFDFILVREDKSVVISSGIEKNFTTDRTFDIFDK